jgi:hypothetical protein
VIGNFFLKKDYYSGGNDKEDAFDMRKSLIRDKKKITMVFFIILFSDSFKKSCKS